MIRNLTLAAMAVTLTSLAAPTAFAQDAAKGEAVFKRCAACHAVGEGAANKAGPELNGIVGRKIAAAPDFSYDDALKTYGEGKTWDEATLDKWLENPKALVPGNKMAFVGLKKEDERKNLIAYLAQYDETGKKK